MPARVKVKNKLSFILVACALVGLPAQSALAQTSSEPAPPILLVPPPAPGLEPDIQGMGDDLYEAPAVEDDDVPLSIIEVPLLETPEDETAEDQERPLLIGRFSLLHKVTGKISTLALRSGEPVTIEDLTVIMYDCLSQPPEEVPDTRVFLQVFETQGGVDVKLFSGWMFASSPGIHALDHPVYDLWPLACTTEDGVTYTGPDLL